MNPLLTKPGALMVLLCSLCIGFSNNISANNLQVSNLMLSGQNTSAGQDHPDNSINIQFTVSWNNSWRTSTQEANWDAAWIFVKYRKKTQSVWRHVKISANGHTVPSAASLDVPPDRVGAFVFKSNPGISANVSYPLALKWNYNTDGNLTDQEAAYGIEISVMGIEMVYISQGGFSLGSGGTGFGEFIRAVFNTPFPVSSEAAIGISSSINITTPLLWYNGSNGAGDSDIGPPGTLPSAFPKGYQAFYIMKYEISQQQYAEFLNKLNPIQKSNRVPSPLPTTFRYTVTENNGTYTAASPDLPYNFMSYQDGAAYLDWSGLRPMTEFEFEKACRGGQAPVAEEYAWGNGLIHSSAYLLASSGTSFENITNPGIQGNAAYASTSGPSTSINGPVRCGIFASSAFSKNRQQTGGSWYGVMELSGNLWERVVSIGSIEGRNFTGLHGDGIISNAGFATTTNWPGWVNGQVTSDTGTGFRGGSWQDTVFNKNLTVSDREFASWQPPSQFQRLDHYGFRGVRTAQ